MILQDAILKIKKTMTVNMGFRVIQVNTCLMPLQLQLFIFSVSLAKSIVRRIFITILVT